MICPYCGKDAVWCENKEVYGRNYGRSVTMWLCKPCNAYVGCHQNTQKPLGTMANSELRKWRMMAHEAVDPFWKYHPRKYKRTTVYKRLSEAFGRPIHIGESDIATCQEIIKTVPLIFTK